MGILTVRDPKELEAMRGQGRPGGTARAVLIQEGVPTLERMHEGVAEPVVCMMDRYVVGGFYRVHADRGSDESLKAPGASFVPLAFAEPAMLARPGEKPGISAPNRFYMYGVVARLAMLAASYELEQTDPDTEEVEAVLA
jgi:glutamate--cysteine ligase